MPNDTGTALTIHNAYQPPTWLLPQSFAEIEKLADKICRAGWVPKAYIMRDGTANQAMVEVAIMHGMEVGLRPMAALQGIAVINGTPTLWGDAMLALVEQSGLMEDFLETFEGSGDELAAICTVKRINRPTPSTQRFSVAMAKRANLWGKQGPWTQYPSRMLTMRARSWALRGRFSDVLKGLHSAEEALDMDGAPVIASEPRPTRGRASSKGSATAIDTSFSPATDDAAQSTTQESQETTDAGGAEAQQSTTFDAELINLDGEITAYADADKFAEAFLTMLESTPDLGAVWESNPAVLATLTDAGRADLAKEITVTDQKLQQAREKAPEPKADARPHAEFFGRKSYLIRVGKDAAGIDDLPKWVELAAMLYGEAASAHEAGKLHADNMETVKRLVSFPALGKRYEEAKKGADARVAK